MTDIYRKKRRKLREAKEEKDVFAYIKQFQKDEELRRDERWSRKYDSRQAQAKRGVCGE